MLRGEKHIGGRGEQGPLQKDRGTINRGDLEAFDELMAPDLAEEFKRDVSELRRTFPDYHGTNEIQVAEGDLVANRFVFYGAHQGEFMGVRSDWEAGNS